MLSWPAFAPGRRSRLPWVPAALFLFAAAAAAQPPAAAAGPPAEPDPEVAHATAPVVVDGATLFRVRGSSGYPAEERARRIAERIVEVARVPSIAPEAVRAEPSEGLFNVTAGDRVLLVVTAADARVEAIEQAVVARIYVDRIQRAVRAYREARRPAVLVDGARRAAAATAVFAVALVVMAVAHRRLRARVARRYQQRVQSVQFQSFEIVRAQRIWDAFETVMRLVRLATVAVLAYFWLHFVLSSFPVTRPLAVRLLSLVLEPLSLLGGGLLAHLPNLVFLLVLYFVTRWLLGLLRLFFDAVGKGRVELSGFEPEWALPTYRILRVVAVGLALVVAYPYIPGSQSAAFQGISIFLGLMFSLGSSSFIANSIAGYSMTYRRAFRIGDRIRVGDTFGDVTEIRLQVTHLRSPKNEEIVVPNSTLLTSSVVNYSALARSQGLILHTTVGIGYETPWRQVEAMLLLAAERTEGLSREPAPFVLQKSLGDFCVVYELNVYCHAPTEMMQQYTRLHRSILDVFNEYGVQIMTPAYEGDPERPKVVPKDQWWTAPARRPPGAAAPGDDAKED
jgi:small-conductance mechanosensitive channel